MPENFQYDVFLSHSSKDKPVVRSLAERLRRDGLSVFLDEWEIFPGDSIPSKIEDGLEHSRVLVFCMSKHAFGSDWATLESQTFRFRDPLNKGRRFIPLRLDEAAIKGSLSQFLYVNWLSDEREQEYIKLFEACRPPAQKAIREAPALCEIPATASIQLRVAEPVFALAFSPNRKQALCGGQNRIIQLWDLETEKLLRSFSGHNDLIQVICWSSDGSRFSSGGADKSVRIWDLNADKSVAVLEGHTAGVWCMAWSASQHHLFSGGSDKTLRLWDIQTARPLRVFEGHTGGITNVAWSSDDRYALSCGDDKTIRLWSVQTGRQLRVLEGHTGTPWQVIWSGDDRFALSAGYDSSVRVWDVWTGSCLQVLEGHTSGVLSLALTADNQIALSSSLDNTIRIWDMSTGNCLSVLEHGSAKGVNSSVWSADQTRVFSSDTEGGIKIWDPAEIVGRVRSTNPAGADRTLVRDQIQYTNAKVLLVGDGDAGKTGLSKRLAGGFWEHSDKTFGAWATQWKLPVTSHGDLEREIWLWDFGGQADQRLVHQLYMQDAALAVLVFDGQREDLFETLGQWDRDLTHSSGIASTKLLAAGRVDLCPLRVSRSQVETFAKERGFAGRLFETSAKFGTECEALKQAILDGIRWEEIPWRSSPLLFKRLKEEIVRLKDDGRVLMRFNELRDALHLRMTGEKEPFKDDELKAVVGLLAGPGMVWELAFGNWVLLQPERINTYAQAVIQTMREDEYERGCLPEERVLTGTLTYHSSLDRLGAEEERFVLLAMHQILVEHGLCLREHTEKGPLLIFPSYYRRERPDLVVHPAVLVSYRFNGFLDDIYATLVVRLHHTGPFQHDKLWRYAADFKTVTGKQLGIKLTRREEGSCELEVYFDPTIPVEEKITFSRYVHEHLLQKGQDVVRLRHYVCPHCSTPVGNREVAMRRLEAWTEKTINRTEEAGTEPPPLPTIICSECERRIFLWDHLEQCFANPEMRQRVQALQKQSATILGNESKERALVGEVISTVALAGQISREFNVSDHGIDMEIEFKDNAGEATGQRLYLQLKSGDSYLRHRQRGHVEVFTIKKERHARYWMAQTFPVMLVIRTSDGLVRWMEVRDLLKHDSKSEKPVKEIIFEGERFDVMSVRRWRDKVLGSTVP
jgi:WD40 repeat protein